MSPISKTLNTPNDRAILITGVTGHQGGAVARALKSSGFRLRGMTRKPESEPAAALARDGVEIVKGDLDDETTLRRALAGAWGVFGVQNTWEAGVERDTALMLEWFERVGYSADIAGLEREFGRALTKLADWARRS